uniref:Reverse transcriptase zinc-binding domain-containing protein n=1 Tax=Trichogramma kaykai TaxID=54128 RepID=A0ABD2WXJ8_9HYME
MIENGKCSCEMFNEDLNHVLWQCKKYDVHRKKLIYSLKSLNYTLPLNIESFLTCKDITAMKKIMIFFKECDLKV